MLKWALAIETSGRRNNDPKLLKAAETMRRQATLTRPDAQLLELLDRIRWRHGEATSLDWYKMSEALDRLAEKD